MSSSPKFIATEGEDFEVVQQSRAFNSGPPVSALKVDGTTGKIYHKNAKILDTLSIFQAMHAGHNGAGAVTLTGVNVGDKVIGAMNITTPGDITSGFEATITVKDQIQQTSVSDLSAKQIIFTVAHA